MENSFLITSLIVVGIVLFLSLIGNFILFLSIKDKSKESGPLFFRVLNYISIIISVTSLIAVVQHTNIYPSENSKIELVATFIGICTTFIIGFQIYKTISDSSTLKKVDSLLRCVNNQQDRLNKKFSEIESVKGTNISLENKLRSVELQLADLNTRTFMYQFDNQISNEDYILALDVWVKFCKLIFDNRFFMNETSIRVLISKFTDSKHLWKMITEEHIANHIEISENITNTVSNLKRVLQKDIILANKFEECFNTIEDILYRTVYEIVKDGM